jgi:hypothetical protein
MFNISDVMIDKEEVSISFHIPISLPDNDPDTEVQLVRAEQILVSDESGSVSESHMKLLVKK